MIHAKCHTIRKKKKKKVKSHENENGEFSAVFKTMRKYFAEKCMSSKKQ